jgi:multimeric flavodoxin WrbA
MPLKVLILVGNRDPNGRSGRAASALKEGLLAGGAQVESITLLEKKLLGCVQRGQDGFGECLEMGTCKLEDDFAGLVDTVRAADMVCFVTPVYWGGLSEVMQTFLGRLRRIGLHENGKKGISGKKAMGVCVAGGGGGGSINCCDLMQRILGHCEFDVVDMVPVRKQNLEHKLEVLRMSGRWLATGAPDQSKAAQGA